MYLRGYETRYGANSDRTTPYNKYIAKLVQKEVTAQPSIMSRNLYHTANSLSLHPKKNEMCKHFPNTTN
jgi:hypothetical protein